MSSRYSDPHPAMVTSQLLQLALPLVASVTGVASTGPGPNQIKNLVTFGDSYTDVVGGYVLIDKTLSSFSRSPSEAQEVRTKPHAAIYGISYSVPATVFADAKNQLSFIMKLVGKFGI